MRRLVLLSSTLALLAALGPLASGFAQTPTPTAPTTPTPLPTSADVTVTSVTPTSGSVISPTTVTVNGTGFSNDSTIMLEGRAVPTSFVDATTLRTTILPGQLPVGTYSVSVVTNNTTSNVLPGDFAVVGLGAVLYVPVAVKGVVGDDSGIQVQNTSTSPASVYLVYYDQSGNAVTTDGPQNVAGGSSWTFYQPGDTSLPSGFDGSAVVHSTQPVAAIVNRVNYASSLASAGSITIPAATNATQAVVPLVYGGVTGYVTTLSIQNTSTTPATYGISLVANSSTLTVGATQVTIPPSAARRIRVGTDIAVPSEFIGTATISSPSAAFVAVGETLNSSSSILLGYAGVSTGATTMNAPLLYKNYNGWVSGAQVANMTGGSITVNASIRNRDTGVAIGLPPVTLAPNQGYFYDLATIANLPDGFVGSGVFTTSGPAAASVQGVNATRSTGMAYSGFSAGTENISIPLVFKDSNAWDTGVQVQNLGAADTTVSITYYTTTSDLTVSESETVSPGNSVTFYQPANASLPSGLTGSATVTSSSQPIVAIVNEVNYARGGDAAMAYEGINY